MNDQSITVEVAYATPEEQVILRIDTAPRVTLRQAIEKSGILTRFPDIDLAVNKVGVFGKAKSIDAVLTAGDRVEIYRPLIADPKEARKRRAAQGKAMKKGAGEQPPAAKGS